MRKYLIILFVSLICFGCSAHRLHRHCHPRRHHQVVVVKQPASPSVVSKITARDRMNMAISYLNANRQMSVKAYSKMTGLPKATAEAELDAFALDKNIPIGIMMNGNKKVYVLSQVKGKR